MLKNYFIIATRSLARHKFFTIINVLGMAIGMSVSLLVIGMLAFLWQYDTFHANKSSLYRIVTKRTNNLQQTDNLASAPLALADRLEHHYAGIDKIVRVSATLSGNAAYNETEVPLRGYFVDPEFIEVFTFPLLKGNDRTALENPNTLLITETAAKKMFGDADPVGKVISLPDLGEFEITGLLRDLPKNSHMNFEVLASYQTVISLQKRQQLENVNDWLTFKNTYIYLHLPDAAKPQQVENFLSEISQEIYAREKDVKASFKLQPLLDIVPGEDLRNPIGPSWEYSELAILWLLTLMILLPACFNYANISISRALKRMKEIGLRKVMGGQKNQIFFQFITETVLISLIALFISVGIFYVIRQEFLSMIVDGTGLELELSVATIAYFVLFASVVGLFSGIIPAIYFSKLTPIQALRAKPVSKGFKTPTFRKILVVAQFALSLGFIMGVVIVVNQYRYSLNFDVGFQQENILDVELQKTDPDIFRNEFSRLTSVQTISFSSHVLGTSVAESIWVSDPESSDSSEVFQMFVDEAFIPNMNLTMIAGKNFLPGNNTNRRSVIVNEEFLKAFQIRDASDAAGRVFVLPDKSEVTVVGVVKNFHYMHLIVPVKSFFFRYDPSKFEVANVRMSSNASFSTLTEMETAWKTLESERKFNARFFEDEIEEAYSIYLSVIKICGFLGFLAISISCLGLLGMVVFNVENRVKKIGIRKVMGSSELNVVLLLSGHFLKLMLIAAVISVPLSWLFFEKVFLSRHYYKISIGISEVGPSILLMMVIGLTTILSQTVRAAKANPVDSLRSE